MTGPVRSATTVKARAKDIQPPRPPNAWILYRSDKLKSLPPEQPGGQRRAQADVSKLISEMWRNESEAVKLEYERLADAKKAEHQRLYPSYRFQPMKKEEKERLREEKRQEKERVRAQKKKSGRTNAAAGPSHGLLPMPPMGYPAPYFLPGAIPMHMPHPQYMVYNPEAQFGPAGPSPPLSAASSPNDTTSASESPPGPDELLMQPSAVPSARTSPIPDVQYQASQQQPSGVVFPSSFHQSLLLQPENDTQPMPTQQSQAPQTRTQWQPPQDQVLPQPSGSGAAHQTFQWDDFSTSQFDFDHPQLLKLDIPFTNDVTSEDLTYEGLQAMLSSTSENGVFGLENINPAELVTHPQGELEIAMAPQPDAHSLELGDMFDDFDFGTEFATAAQEMESGTVNPLDTVVQPSTSYNDFASLFQAPNNPELQSYTAAQQRQPSFFTRGMLEYINFDEVAEGGLHNPPTPQVRHPPPPPTQSTKMPIFTQMTNTPVVAHSGYIPPAGAANSSTRRVAASWKPSFAVHDDCPAELVQAPWNQ